MVKGCFLVLICLQVAIVAAQIFRLPDKSACETRKIHFTREGKNYHLSWLEAGRNIEFTWEGARNYCRKFCMDSITIDSEAENQMVKTILRRESIAYIWTGGHKCNFRGCERKDLQPAIENGWYWAHTGIRLRPPGQCQECDWSNTGGLGEPQPDNREFRSTSGGEDEACIAILNNFYQDGIRWHDVGCRHTKPVICQDVDILLDYVNVN